MADRRGVAVLNLGLSILWVQTLGVGGVILATVVAYGVTALWVMPLDVAKFLRGRR